MLVNTFKDSIMNKNFKKYLIYLLILGAGLFIGYLIFNDGKRNDNQFPGSETSLKESIWTCSMHPQIRRDTPGDCPICGMDLIPLNSVESDSGGYDMMSVHLTPEAAQLANVMTTIVARQKPVRNVRLFGKIAADERMLQSITAHVPGRIERLLVSFTGETINKGQVLAEIYSPELMVAQQELIVASQTKESRPEIYNASRERLLNWRLSEAQINEIERSGKVQSTFPIISNESGIVMARRANQGDHLVQGTVLFDIADLSNVWALFDAYESDIMFLNKGDKVTFSSQAIPGTEYTGKIDFIDPVIDPISRVARVRVEVNNRDGKLKPEMFITGNVNADLDNYEGKIVIPRSAVLWTGKRSIVYVKTDSDEAIFRMREIETGPFLGNSYIVLEGLEEGEEIVTNGTFSIDAAAQLQGKPSMMNVR